MDTMTLTLNHASVPAVLYGSPSPQVWLCLHGKGGRKEEAESFAQVVCPKGWQVLAIDLPGHGARAGALHPLARCPRVERPALPVRTEVEPPGPPGRQPGGVVLPAGLSGPPPGPSPLRLPGAGHGAPDPGDDVLGRGDRVTPGGRGRDLQYVRAHPVSRWETPTRILWAQKDHLVPRDTVDRFARRFRCSLTAAEGMEHWFHTPEQLAVLRQWEEEST